MKKSPERLKKGLIYDPVSKKTTTAEEKYGNEYDALVKENEESNSNQNNNSTDSTTNPSPSGGSKKQ